MLLGSLYMILRLATWYTLKKVIMEFLAKELLSLIMNMMQIAQMNILMLEK